MVVTPEVRAAAGKELSRRLIVEDRALGAAISAKGPIAVYLASKEEIDLADFITAALSVGCAVVAPRWNGTDYELVRLQDFATLVKGPHGILEPPAGPAVRPEDVRAWLVPGLAFTKDGGRLGYGGGWYDRLLCRAAKQTPKIGIAYGFQLVDELQSGGATHGGILAAVREEGAATRQFIDRRANETDARLGRLDAKLDRLESKLDRLLKIAETPPTDGMIRVE